MGRSVKVNHERNEYARQIRELEYTYVSFRRETVPEMMPSTVVSRLDSPLSIPPKGTESCVRPPTGVYGCGVSK